MIPQLPHGGSNAARFSRPTLLAVAFIVLASMLSFLSPQLIPRGDVAYAWLTVPGGTYKLSPQSNLYFSANGPNVLTTIDIGERRLQQIDGFGAAMTDTSAWLLETQLSNQQRDKVMRALFDPANGIGISFVRIPMGASDFIAHEPYTYDDMPTGEQDPQLKYFSIAHDMAYILPALRQAHTLNPQVKFLATPWTAPAWMKSNGSLFGAVNKQAGRLRPEDYPAFAEYFVKFIQAYQAAGIPIYAVVPQNEPLNAVSTYPGMVLSAQEEANFIKNYLGPALRQANLSPKVLAYDQGMDHLEYPQQVLSDEAAATYITGTAWHCYSGNLIAMDAIHRAFPQQEIYETECSTGPQGIAAYSAIEVILGSTSYWARTATLWNIALDSEGGPKIGQGCIRCTGLLTVNRAHGSYTLIGDYYQLGHFSKFITPGAYHVETTTTICRFCPDNLESVAFTNADGSKILVVYNHATAASTFRVRQSNLQAFTYTLPPQGTVTFKWWSS
jgi:glucosylceramidase